MLSIKRCRKILGKKSKLSDEELEKVRDDLYALADICIEAFLEKREKERQAKRARPEGPKPPKLRSD